MSENKKIEATFDKIVERITEARESGLTSYIQHDLGKLEHIAQCYYECFDSDALVVRWRDLWQENELIEENEKDADIPDIEEHPFHV